MNQKAFDLIVSKLTGVLEAQGFQKQKDLVDEAEGKAVLFIGENSVYSVLYNEEETRFELRSTDMTDEGPDENKWKSISNWIFDQETDGLKEAESIASDFLETLQGPSRQEAIRRAKRKPPKTRIRNTTQIRSFSLSVWLRFFQI